MKFPKVECAGIRGAVEVGREQGRGKPVRLVEGEVMRTIELTDDEQMLIATALRLAMHRGSMFLRLLKWAEYRVIKWHECEHLLFNLVSKIKPPESK